MRWITLLLALLLAPGFELAAKAGDQQTGETARAAENAMRERRDNQKTIAEETEIIRLDGGEAEESCRTVWSAASQGDLPRTISAFGEFQAACANCTTAYLHRARCYQADGEWDKTIADCTAILRIDLRNAAAYSMRGACRCYKREYDKALADCNQALAIDPNCADAYVNRGDIELQKHELDKALADCDKGLRLDPKFAKGYLVRGLVWSDKGELDKALGDWEEALSLTPDDWKLLNNVGVGSWQKAQEQDRLAARAEAAGDLQAAKASRKTSTALKNKAREKWNRGIAIRPTATDILSNLGYADSEANDLGSAERHLTEAVRLQPGAARPHNNLGRVLLRRSKQSEADALAAEAKGKTDPAEAVRAGMLRDAAKAQRDAAVAEFEAAIALNDPALPEADMNLAEVYLTEHDLDKAETHFRAALKLQSDRVKDRDTINTFSNAHAGLAKVAVARDDRDEAVADLRKALELNPQNVAAMQLLATVRFQQGEYREGEKCLAGLLAMLPAAQRRRRRGAVRQAVRNCRQDRRRGAGLDLSGLDLRHGSRFPAARRQSGARLIAAGSGVDEAAGCAGARHAGRGPGRQRPLPRSGANCAGRDQAGRYSGQEAFGRGHCPAFAVVPGGKTVPLRSRRQR